MPRDVPPVALAVAHVNSDATPELLILYRDGFMITFRGPANSDGSFPPSAISSGMTVVPDGETPIAIAASSITSASPDVIVLSSIDGGGKLRVFATARDYRLTLSSTFDLPCSPTKALVADLNSDSKADVIVFGRQCVVALYGNGDHSFTTVQQLSCGESPYSDSIIGDLDGDGAADLITASYTENGQSHITVCPHMASGSTPLHTFSLNFPGAYALHLGDINADGNLDLLLAEGEQNTVGVLFGSGDGTFHQGPISYSVGRNVTQMVAGDLNYDDYMDLVLLQSTGFVFFTGFADGTLHRSLESALSTETASAFAVADLNRDGAADLVAIDPGTNSVFVLMNQNSVAVEVSTSPRDSGGCAYSYPSQYEVVSVSVKPTYPGSRVPAGTVTLFADGRQVGVKALDSTGYASAVATLSVGYYGVTIRAVYSSTNGYAGSSGTAVAVHGQPTSVRFVAPTGPVPPQTPVTISVQVSCQFTTPNGSVILYDGDVPLNESIAGLLNKGNAKITAAFAAGTHLLTARYSGGYLSTAPDPVSGCSGVPFAPSSGQMQLQALEATTTTIEASRTEIIAGETVNFSIHVASATGVPDGYVRLDGPSGGVSYLLSDGRATVDYRPSNGTYRVTYLGNSQFAASTSTPVSITVYDDFSLALQPAIGAVGPGQDVTSGVRLAAASSPSFSDNVRFSCSGLPPGTSCDILPTSVSKSITDWTEPAALLLRTTRPSAANSGTPPGDYTVIIHAASDHVSHDAVFSVTVLPVPFITSLNPSATTVASPGFTLAVVGDGFQEGDFIQWNGVSVPTTYVSRTQLTAAIPAASLATIGTAAVRVFDTTPLSEASSPQTFTVGYPRPTISSLEPSGVFAGAKDFTVAVNGSNFVPASVVTWNGYDRATTFIDSTHVSAVVTAEDVANFGSGRVSVRNPSPGGGTSTYSVFTVKSDFALDMLATHTAGMQAGNNAVVVLSVRGNGDFSGTVVFTCATETFAVSCRVIPERIDVNSTTQLVYVAIGSSPTVATTHSLWPTALWCIVPFAFVVVPKTKKHALARITPIACVCLCILAETSCGTGEVSPRRTGASTYTVVVTGTYNSLARSISVPVIVNR